MSRSPASPSTLASPSVLAALRAPVLPESRALLDKNWRALPLALQTPHQMFGRQGNGCGAPIGAMPRCDFACRGCYLGDGANKIPAQSVEAIKAQMRALRPALGPAGNLQLTDGEVTLRPAEEIIELLRYARSLDLIPMLMTHGDTFRRRDGLLHRLVKEGGLTELSIHVDTTQRGRMGAWRHATTEAELNGLRAEFGALLRRVREETGIVVRAATTMTVTPENIDGVADVVRWLRQHPDDFFMISFQPIAQVGRTEDGLGDSVDVEQLWRAIAKGLYDSDGSQAVARLLGGQKWLGHPGCNRFVHGVFATRTDHAASTPANATFHPVRQQGDAVDEQIVDGFLSRFGGLSFRRDTRAVAMARALGVFLRAPRFVGGSLLPFARHWLRRLDAESPWRALRELWTGALEVRGFLFVSHHFMSRAQLETPLGQERVAHCVFQVPINGTLTSMCEVNAMGIREAYYADISAPTTSAPVDEHSFVS
ncbi:MAG: radical SAM protein [Gemmatimonadaceae bacterium]|nr:radical SAM protein [Gemmatimonadaceae bacterium]